jgi:aflatoxin B1 aldehyde reductase
MELIRQACNVANISMVEATYRWLLCHSALSENDGVLLGASSVSQLEQNLAACEAARAEMSGNMDPLPPSILEAFEKAWKLTQAAGVFPYWRSYSSDMPERESLDQGASYDAKKK